MSYEGIYEASYDLKDQAREMYKGYVLTRDMPLIDLGRVNRLMEGAIDVHIHPGPDAWATRPLDDIEVAIQACDAGMGAVVYKCHSGSTARSANFVQKVVDQWAKEHNKKSTKVIGGIVLNYVVGGLNSEAVIATARFGGKFIWTSTIDSSHQRRMLGQPGGIEFIDKDKVVPEFAEILEIIAKYDMVLSICHHTTRERFIMLDAAREAGVKRIEICHPLEHMTKMTFDQMKMAADKGAFFGHYCLDFTPPAFSWDETMEMIKEIGADHIILSTDLGKWNRLPPVSGYRIFISMLLDKGIAEADLEKMVKLNAEKLIWGTV